MWTVSSWTITGPAPLYSFKSCDQSPCLRRHLLGCRVAWVGQDAAECFMSPSSHRCTKNVSICGGLAAQFDRARPLNANDVSFDVVLGGNTTVSLSLCLLIWSGVKLLGDLVTTRSRGQAGQSVRERNPTRSLGTEQAAGQALGPRSSIRFADSEVPPHLLANGSVRKYHG